MGNYKELIIKKVDTSLKGCVTLNKKEIALDNTIIGEVVNIETEGSKEKEHVTKVQIITPSSHRVKPVCPVYLKCGSCSLQHLEYAEQLNLKTRLIESLYTPFKVKVEPTIGMSNPYHYRNKSQMVFKFQKGKLVSGFYEEGTHDVINFDNCYLQNEYCNKIITTIKELMTKFRISAYDEDRNTGLIRHVLIKTSTLNEVLVVLVTGSDNFPGKSNFTKALVSRCNKITTVIQNVNSRKTSAVLGDKEYTLYGKGYIKDILLGKTFKITSKSFYQINHEQTEKLYQKVIELANIKKDEVVLDAYCGVGTIGILLSPNAKKVIGVELVKDAVMNANKNALLNDIKNISFFCFDATPFIVNMARSKEHLDVLIMDPPRSGSTKEFLKAVLMIKPKRIIYVSCNPLTQVEDLKYLINDYTIKTVQPVDMFPQTSHVETITLLYLKQK